MGVCVTTLGHERRLKLALRLQDQSLVEKAHSRFGEGGRVLLRRQGGQALLFHLLHFKGGLAEGGFVEGPLDPLQGRVLRLPRRDRTRR